MPYHIRTGAALCELAELVLRCGACGKIQTQSHDADAKLTELLPVISCASCGRLGLLRVWLPNKDEGDAAAAILARASARKGAA